MLGLLVLLTFVGLMWRYIVLTRKVSNLTQKTIALSQNVIDEQQDCMFWMRVSEQMERSGGTSELLNQRREGRRIIDRLLD